MNLFKRTTASVALIALVSSVFTTGVSAASSDEIAAASALATKGYINTQTNVSDYNLDMFITRAEISKVAANVAELSASASCENKFSDVSATTPNNWVCGYVEVLVANGLIAANTKYNPNANLTKAEAVKLMLTVAGEEVSFDNSTWQADFVSYAVENGFVSNFTDYNTSATRGFVFSVAAAATSTSTEEDGDDILSELDKLLGDTDEDTTDTTEDDTTTVVTGNGDLEVTLSATTPKAATVPYAISGLPVASFDFTAGSEDITITNLVVKRNGLSDELTLAKLAVFSEEGRASKSRNDSQENGLQASLTLDNGGVVVKAGETRTLTVVVDIPNNVLVSNDEFAIELLEVSASSTVEGLDNLTGNTFRIGGVKAATLTIDTDGSVTNPKVGEEAVEIFKFKVTGENNEDVTVKSLTFKSTDSNVEDNLANIALTQDGDVVATVASMDSKYLTFNLVEGFVIPEGKNVKFKVTADIISGANDAFGFYIDTQLDVTAEGSKYGYGASATITAVDDSSTPELGTVTLQAGELTIEKIEPSMTDIRKDKDNIVLGTFVVNSNAGKNLELQQFAVTIDSTTANVQTLIENVELYDATHGTVYDLTVPAASTSEKYSENDLAITLPTSGELRLVVRADTLDTATLDGDTLRASINIASDVVVKETDDDKTVTDVTPAAMTFKTLNGVASAAAVNIVAMSTTKSAVIGSEGLEVLTFEIESTNDASSLVVDEIKVQGTIADNGTTGTAVLDNTRVNSVSLYNGDTLLDQVSGSQLSSGVATFDGFKVTVDANGSERFTVKVSVADDQNQALDTLQFAIESDGVNLNVSIEDDEADDVEVVGAVDLSSARLVTITGVGTLNIAVDNTDNETDKAKNVLAGNTSNFVASYELTATNEAILLKDIEVVASHADFASAVSEVVLYADDKTTELGRKIVTSTTVKFDNVNVLVDEGNQNIYVKVVARKIGKDQAGKFSADITLTLEATDIEGDSSNIVIASGGASAASLAFKTVPVKVSAISFVDSFGGVSVATKLNSGENNVAIIAVTTDSSVNTDDDDNSSLKTLLTQMQLTETKLAGTTVGGYTIEEINGNGSTVAATVGGGLVTFDMTAAGLATDDELDNGTTTYYLVKATGVAKDATTDNDDYIKVEFTSFAAGQVSYQSDDTGNNDTSVTDLRLSMTKLDGTQINE